MFFRALHYFIRTPVRFSPEFPFVRLNSLSPRRYPSAKIDLPEPIASIPSAMPALCALSLCGLLNAVRTGKGSRLAVMACWIAILPTSAAMFCAIAVSHRYTADFVPFLITAAMFGLVAIELAPPVRRRRGYILLTALTAWSIAVTVGLTINFETEVWGVPRGTHERLLEWRDAIDKMLLRDGHTARGTPQ